MALSGALKTAVDAAFLAADDAVTDIVYHRHTGNAQYDPANGQVTESLSDVDMQCIFSGYKAHETYNSAIQATDVKGLIPGKYFDFKPSVGSDTITDDEGEKFDIINAMPDPFKATYTMQLRRIA